MRTLIALLLLMTPVMAAPAYVDCVSQDGSRFSMAANKGEVLIKWPGYEWSEAFGEVNGDYVNVTQITSRGVIVIAWNVKTKATYVAIKNDKTGQVGEYNARCWFK